MAHIHHFAYGWITPALSYALSVLGSLLGLTCAIRVRVARSAGQRTWWLALASFAIGGTAIWSMHFMAMLGVGVSGLAIRYDVGLTVASAVLAVVALTLVLRFTPLGRRIRAVVQNRDLAAVSGVPTGRVDRLTFFIGSGLAGGAGVALTLLGPIGPTMGTNIIIDAFLVVVAGGIGYLRGSVLVAFLLGVQSFGELKQKLFPSPPAASATPSTAVPSPRPTPGREALKWRYVEDADTACARTLTAGPGEIDTISYDWMTRVLTAREREVLGEMAEGRSNAAIAAKLYITEKAVSKHINNILTKLDMPPSEDDNRRVLAVLAYLNA